jgi:hypothetical protein
MTPEQRQALRERYSFRCGYCGVHEHQIGAELTVDHFQPRSRGGTDDADNLVYCCHACNEHKGNYWLPNAAQRLLHPLLDDLDAHVAAEADGTVRGLTETGACHIQRLRPNRAPLVARRLRWRRQASARAIQEGLLEQLGLLQQRFSDLRAHLAALERPPDTAEEE